MGDQNVQAIQSRSKDHSMIYIQANCPVEQLHEIIVGYPQVEEATGDEEGVVVKLKGGVEERVAFLVYLIEHKIPVYGFANRDLDLEDLFLSLTKGDVQ